MAPAASGLALLAGCVSAPRPDARITGTAFTRTRIFVPPEAVFEAVLLDVTDDNAPPVALARQRVEPAGVAPFDINIPFVSARMQRNGKYLVQAQVTLYNELLFYSPGTHPVTWDPSLHRADILLEPYPRINAMVHANIPLMQTHWRLLSVGEEATQPVSAPEEGAAPAFIQFHAPTSAARPGGAVQGAFSGSGGCNRFLGLYELSGDQLRLKLGTTSIRLCLAGGKDEPAILSALAQVGSFTQKARELVLRDQDGKVFLHLRAEESGEPHFEPYEPEDRPQ